MYRIIKVMKLSHYNGHKMGLILGMCLLGLTVHPVAGVNLVPNPGFETSSGWIYGEWEPYSTTGVRGYQGAYDNAVKYAGTRSVKITCTNETGRAAWYLDPPIAVVTDKIYKVSVYVKAEGGTDGDLTYWFYGPDESHPIGFDKGTYDWRKCSFYLIAPTNATSIRLYLQNTGKGTYWFDEVSFEEVNPAEVETIAYGGKTFVYNPRYQNNIDPALSSSLLSAYGSKGYVTFCREPRYLYPENGIPQPEEATETLENFACPGQYAPFWFAVYGIANINDVAISLPGGLMSENGNTISTNNIKLNIIKFWEQRCYWSGQSYYKIPELLDDLPAPADIDIPAGTSQGFWVQVKVPAAAASGTYQGTITVAPAGKTATSMKLSLQVLPFQLKKPGNINWLMYSDLLQRYRGHGQTGPHTYTDDELRKYISDMQDYGITGLIESLYWYDTGHVWKNLEFAQKTVSLMHDIGMTNVVVFGSELQYMVAQELGVTLTGTWMTLHPEMTNSVFESAYRAKLQELDPIVNNAGISEWYEYVIDEPHNADRMPLAIWQCANAATAGIKTYATVYPSDSLEELIPYGLDADANSYMTENESDNLSFHALCNLYNTSLWYLGAGCYTSQEGGLMPDRYGAGFLLYKSGAKAHVSWTYQNIKGTPLTDLDGTGTEPKDACITYPATNITSQKVTVSTLQWEGIREGIDDYRYAYTLQELITEVNAMGFTSVAQEAQIFLNNLLAGMPWSETWQVGSSYSNKGNFSNSDAQSTRRQIADKIIQLQIAVTVAPAITTQPSGQTVTVGQTATFSVTATGTAPLSYQWRKNGANIAGATAASYTTPATVAGDNGAQFTVVVTNPAGSATSAAATLITKLISAPSPTASKGAYADKVLVYWNAILTATSYEVWRGTSSNAQYASLLGDCTTSFYLDTSTTPDVLYYYWIQAIAAAGGSGLGPSDYGYCGSVANLTSPTGVQASKGTYTDRIWVAWQAVNSATRYEVWRNTENIPATARLVGEPTETNYNDLSVAQGIYYYYWIRAGNANKSGDYSGQESGWCRLSPPNGVSASKGSYPYHIRVAWNALVNAAWYEVWREEVPGSNSDGGHLTKVAQTEDVYLDDYQTKSGVYYNYKVKSGNGLCSSLDYGHDTGYRQVNASPASSSAINDYDGDKLSDLVLFNPLSGVLDALCSALGRQIFTIGAEHGQGVTGDYDGDRLADPVAYCADSGAWLARLSSMGYNPIIRAIFSPGSSVSAEPGGGNGNDPVTADFDGDRLADIGVYNETDGVLSAVLSNGGAFDQRASCLIGGPGCRFVSADFDGDGLADPAVYSESDGRVTVMFSGNEYSSASLALGGPGQAMFAADFDGDGLADPVLYEAINSTGSAGSGQVGTWIVLLSSVGYSEARTSFGGPGYAPVIGDYDGDAKADPAVYRETDGQWLIMFSASGYTVIAETFGGSNCQPVVE